MVRLQHGDSSALDDLYRLHASQALRTAYLITRNQTTAEDVVQDAFVQVFRSIGTLHDPASFRGWFYRIVVNAAKRQARSSPLVALDLANHDKADPTAPTPDERLIDSSEATQLRQAISQLPREQREPVILRYYTGLTDAEIGDALEIPAGTVKSRLHSARKALGQRLERPARTTPPVALAHATERVR